MDINISTVIVSFVASGIGGFIGGLTFALLLLLVNWIEDKLKGWGQRGIGTPERKGKKPWQSL